MTIGKVLGKLIKKRGYTQVEFAKKIEKSTTAISQIVNDVYEPNPETLDKICLVLEVPKPILYFMMLSENDIPDEKKKLFNEFEPILKEFITNIMDDKSLV